ncbi:GRIP and coiled-coil domain-containing protein 1-like [Amphibalanus amphitrite]|uniref:GRIP and coiled-coil domain-containing protein 1-like n=1 Tax=Amphibalanus amphitrite TaxID=1232801 RepID=UPI001C928F98|nr:GRIP and coiled-coil domain-containing protein 1-like [Amphibalanus amphitrite]
MSSKLKQEKQESLLKTIDVQKEQLSRYESRLKDLVRAYKSLNKEKEALEASLKVLSTSKSGQSSKSSKKPTDTKDGAEKEKEKTSEDAQSQLATITASMQTLLEEKSKMENNYMADRKAMKADLDKTQAELREATRSLSDVKDRLARSQREREEETKNYTEMLRESQEVLCRERELARQTELRAADLEAELHQRHAADTRTLEMTENADRWQARVAELEQTLCDREERTSSLESHIAEVSASLGRYQQQSVADQASIDRLKDQVTRLEEEARQRSRSSPSDFISNEPSAGDRGGPDVAATVHQLASWLKETPQERPELLLAPLKELLSDGDDTDWRQEYRHLKEEFEKYKVRVMAARKRDPGQATCPSVTTELDTLRKQSEELRLRLRKTCEERDDLERTLRSQVSRLEQSEADLRMAHRSQLASLETQQRLRLAELEQQLAGQRLRTSALLEERDAELRQLREAASGAQPDTAAVSASLSQLGLERHEGQMLHYMQEVARKDKEISNLRRTKHQLESTMRQLQNKMLEREEVLQDEAETLREKIRRLELNSSREGANLEYIKNIVVRYLLSTDAAQKAHILNAISTALRFSDDELRRVRQCQTATWWPAGAAQR